MARAEAVGATLAGGSGGSVDGHGGGRKGGGRWFGRGRGILKRKQNGSGRSQSESAKRGERLGVTAIMPINPPKSSYHATNNQELTFLNRQPRNSEQRGGSNGGGA